MRNRQGISLVSLIITIVVLLILTGTVVMIFKDDGILEKAKQAVFKSDIATFREELKQYVLEKQIETNGVYDKETLTRTSYDEIKEIVKSFLKKYENKVIIHKGEIAINVSLLEEDEQQWAQSLNLASMVSNIVNGDLPNLEKTISNYKIYGNSVQSVIPSPSVPIRIMNLGDSKNLFDEEKYDEISEYTILENMAYSFAKIQLKPNTNYKMSVKRYNGFNGKEKGYLLISDIQGINGSTWSSITHETQPDTSYVNYQYRTGSSGILYIGYNISARMTQNDLDYIWENTDVQIEEGIESTNYMSYNEKYINMNITGKNILDKQQSSWNQIKNGLEVSVWGSEVLDNNWVVNTLKPDTAYTISYKVKCINIPEHTEEYLNNLGFILYSGVSGFSNISLFDTKYIQEGEEIKVIKTFETPSTIHDVTANYRILTYSNRYLNNGIGVSSTVIFSNIQIEEGSNATEYEPYVGTVTQKIDLTGHESLMKVGNVSDYIDYESGQIVRNIGKKEFVNANTMNLVQYRDSIGKTYPCIYGRWILDRKESTPIICTHSETIINNNGITIGTNEGMWAHSNKQYPGHIYWTIPYSLLCTTSQSTKEENVDGFKQYCINQIKKGLPVTIYYQLVEPKYEQITLPKIPNGTVKVEVTDSNNITPSNIEIEYYTEQN